MKPNKIFVDDLNKVRIANPELFESSNTLKTESDKFVENLSSFKSIVDNAKTAVQQVGKIADKERFRAVSAQNAMRLKEADVNKESNEEYQNIRILVQEKQVELERLKTELQSYRNIIAQQLDYIQQLKSTFSN